MGFFESGYVEVGYEVQIQIDTESIVTFKNSITEFEEVINNIEYSILIPLEAICFLHYLIENYTTQTDVEKIYDFSLDVIYESFTKEMNLKYNVPIAFFVEKPLNVHYFVNGETVENPLVIVRSSL